MFFSAMLLTIGISCLIFVSVSSVLIKSNLHDHYLELSLNDMSQIIQTGAKMFDSKINQLTSNVPNIMGRNAEDSFRYDYPFGYINSY